MPAAWKKASGGRNLSPRKGGARLYIMNGMTREATQGLGGWKPPAVIENVYKETRSEGAVPKMRAAASKARAVLDVTSFVEDLDREVCADGDETLGS